MTRPRSDSLVGLSDCKQVMDAAIEHPGLVYELDTVGAAINFRQRCYRFRNLMRELEAERLGSEVGVSTPYDILVIRFIHQEPGKQSSRFLQYDHKEVLGKLHFPDGRETPLQLPKASGIFPEEDN